MVQIFQLKIDIFGVRVEINLNVTQMKEGCIRMYMSFCFSYGRMGTVRGKAQAFPKSRGNMKPEYLYSIATDLGLQFDGEARVMYGEREGFLLVIEGAQTKNVFTISLSVKQGSEGDLIEEIVKFFGMN